MTRKVTLINKNKFMIKNNHKIYQVKEEIKIQKNGK